MTSIIGGNPKRRKPKPKSDGALNPNDAFVVGRFSLQPSGEAFIIEGKEKIRSIDDVLALFKEQNQLSANFMDERGRKEEKTLEFSKFSQLTKKGIIAQSPLLQRQEKKRLILEKMLKKLQTHNSTKNYVKNQFASPQKQQRWCNNIKLLSARIPKSAGAFDEELQNLFET